MSLKNEALGEAAPTKEQMQAAHKAFAEKFPEGREPVITVKISALEESTFNTRKDFGDLKGLAASIAQVGVLQPLTLRPIPGGKRLEIVFGHRRYRAAKLAGLTEVPAEVRDLSDHQVREAQLVENLQREGVKPLEEAVAFDNLIRFHHFSVEQVAAKIGKSKGLVHARRKLLALSPEGKRALTNGFITTATAVALARKPEHKLQAAALAVIVPKDGKPPMPEREALEFLNREFCQTLKGAPFDLKDSMLVPEVGACVGCKFRSGSTPGLFEDIADHDTCTNTSCFQKKCAAEWAQNSGAAKALGAKVISPGAAKKEFNGGALAFDSDYVQANVPAPGDAKRRTWAELLRDTDAQVYVLPDRQLRAVKAYKRVEALALLAPRHKWAAKESGEDEAIPSTGERPDWKGQEKDRQVRDQVLVELQDRGVAKFTGLSELPALRLVAMMIHNLDQSLQAWVVVEHPEVPVGGVEAWLAKKATAQDLERAIYAAAVREFLGGSFDGFSENARAFAKMVGFDLEAAEKAKHAAKDPVVAKLEAKPDPVATVGGVVKLDPKPVVKPRKLEIQDVPPPAPSPTLDLGRVTEEALVSAPELYVPAARPPEDF